MQQNDSATNFKAVLVCPVCDEDKYRDNEDAVNQFKLMRDEDRVPMCSTKWLNGQKLTGVGFKRLRDDAECYCFETLPSGYEGRPNNEVRFFHFQTCVVKLGTGAEKRAKLPSCTERKIRELYPGEELVGYHQS